jgi:oligosaccharide repeat unit polymerase
MISVYLEKPLAKHLATDFPVFPALGLVCTITSTLVAIVLIPADFGPPGALLPSAFAMTIGLVAAPLFATFRQPKTMLRAENILVMTPVYWVLLDLLQGAYPINDVSRTGVEGAFVAIGVFACAVWIATLVRPLRLPQLIKQAASQDVKPKILFLLIITIFVLGMVRFAYPAEFNPLTMVYALTEPRWSAPWSRGQLGDWDSFLDHMAYFGYLLPTLTILLARKSKPLSLRVVVAIVLSLIMTAFLAQGGARRIVGVIWGAAIICWTLQQQRINIRRLIVLVFSTALLLVVMQTILAYRNSGFQTVIGEDNQLEFDYLHVDDNFLRLAQIIDLVPEQQPYTYEKQILYYVIRPIPRVIWPSKPIDPGFDLPSILGKEGVSLSSSAIGEFYLSLGFIGVLLGGLIYGKLANSISVLLAGYQESSAILVYSLSTMALVAGMRSIIELILMSYMLLAWIVITRLLLIKRSYTMGTQPA